MPLSYVGDWWGTLLKEHGMEIGAATAGLSAPGPGCYSASPGDGEDWGWCEQSFSAS